MLKVLVLAAVIVGSVSPVFAADAYNFPTYAYTHHTYPTPLRDPDFPVEAMGQMR
jgi:hypothetical protein